MTVRVSMPQKDLKTMKDNQQPTLFDTTDCRRALWQGMPEFEQADRRPYHSIIVHFECQADFEALQKLLGYKLPGGRLKASTWYPEKEPERYANKRYIDAEVKK